jgi:O-methyltransferase
VKHVPQDLLQEVEFLNLYRACKAFTLTSVERMYALYQATRFISETGIDGDFVECGVWRGGSSMLVAMTLHACGDEARTLWLYDTYAGMTQPGPEDIDLTGRTALVRMPENGELWACSPIDDVRANMERSGYPVDQFRFVRGPVEETIPASVPSRIALLRLDTDWYASTYHEMRHLYPLLIPGGVLIVDDYGHWQGARLAVDQFLSEQGISLMLHRVDYTGRIATKPFERSPNNDGCPEPVQKHSLSSSTNSDIE